MLKEKIFKHFKSIRNSYPEFYEKAVNKTGSKKYYFLFFSSIITWNFLLGFYLTEKNPLSLLIPFSFFELDIPLADRREISRVYLSDGEGNVFPSDRKLLYDKNDYRSAVVSLATEISRPPYYEVEENFTKKNLNINLKKLPGIHYSIITSWRFKNTLIIDLREASLLSEFQNMRVRIEKGTYEIKEDKDIEPEKISNEDEQNEADKKEISKKKNSLMNSTFLALEKTLFDNFKDIDIIEYRLDGYNKNFLNLDYKLDELKKRE